MPHLKTLSFLFLLLPACAGVEQRGLLTHAEPGSPIDERDLQKHCDLGDQAACSVVSADPALMPSPRIAILQGVAPPDHAVFAALIPKGAALSWFVFDRDRHEVKKLGVVHPVSRGGSSWALQRLDAKGLDPHHSYDLLAADMEGRLVESRRFHTAALDTRELRIALVGGLRLSAPKEEALVVAKARALNPQLIVLAGGNVRATIAKELLGAKAGVVNDYLFRQHAQARASLAFAFERSLLPVAALWSEDEFGFPVGNRDFAFRDQTREAMELFFPAWADESTIVSGPGLAMALQLRDRLLILLDDLSFRSSAAAPTPICERKKRHKAAVCRAPPATDRTLIGRYGDLQARWVADRAGSSEDEVWLLGAAPWLQLMAPGWEAQRAPPLNEVHSAWLTLLSAEDKGHLSLSRILANP